MSNLQFVSKIIEKTVMARLEEHIVDNNLHDPSQSAYKKCHSTETDLLKINNDILASLDNKHCIILASLDLSAAFDTVDHTIYCIDCRMILVLKERLYNGLHHLSQAEHREYVSTATHLTFIN